VAIRLSLFKKGKRIAAVALRLACRHGRCFCFAEVSTGHLHRNDGKKQEVKTKVFTSCFDNNI